jgi:hypothetical protein
MEEWVQRMVGFAHGSAHEAHVQARNQPRPNNAPCGPSCSFRGVSTRATPLRSLCSRPAAPAFVGDPPAGDPPAAAESAPASALGGIMSANVPPPCVEPSSISRATLRCSCRCRRACTKKRSASAGLAPVHAASAAADLLPPCHVSSPSTAAADGAAAGACARCWRSASWWRSSSVELGPCQVPSMRSGWWGWSVRLVPRRSLGGRGGGEVRGCDVMR